MREEIIRNLDTGARISGGLTVIRARIQYGDDIYSDHRFSAEEKKNWHPFSFSTDHECRSNWIFNTRKAIVLHYTFPVVRLKKPSVSSTGIVVSARIGLPNAFVFRRYSHKIDTDVQGRRSFYIVCSLAKDTFLFDRTKNLIRIDFDARFAIDDTNCVYRYGTMYSAKGDVIVFMHVYETKFKHVPRSVCTLFPTPPNAS